MALQGRCARQAVSKINPNFFAATNLSTQNFIQYYTLFLGNKANALNNSVNQN